jgi:hypothetical protein
MEPLPQRQKLGAEFLGPGDLAPGNVAAGQRRRLAATAPGEIRNRREHRRGAAKADDQLAVK